MPACAPCSFASRPQPGPETGESAHYPGGVPVERVDAGAGGGRSGLSGAVGGRSSRFDVRRSKCRRRPGAGRGAGPIHVRMPSGDGRVVARCPVPHDAGRGILGLVLARLRHQAGGSCHESRPSMGAEARFNDTRTWTPGATTLLQDGRDHTGRSCPGSCSALSGLPAQRPRLAER
jgi:hypothetical protein